MIINVCSNPKHVVLSKDTIFHMQVRTIHLEKRINEIVNRLNKTKVEKFPDLREEREGRDQLEREDQKAKQREQKRKEKDEAEQKAKEAKER